MNKTNITLLAILLTLVFMSQSGMASNLPPITGDIWLNSKPLKEQDLRNRIVLVYFWTFGCHNCKAVEPYIKQWHERYSGKDLTIIAVHSPEFNHERKLQNVQNYVADNKVNYPVIIDNDFINWNRFKNRYWPTIYLANRDGKIIYRKIGEGSYEKTEKLIQELIEKPNH